ncbi:MAG: 3-deoxy-D-manno-octulosonate 8-phosphate phosphatase [Myxococcota bacterium]
MPDPPDDDDLTPGPDDGDPPRRAQRVTLVLTDCDGCLTDGGVFYGPEGEVMKRFSIRDGMGMVRLRNAGLPTAIVTGERSPAVARRAEKLRVEAYLGVADKLAWARAFCSDRDLTLAELAFFGDDVNDVPIMRAIAEAGGLTACPQDAMPVVQRDAHYLARVPGGHGAFRDFAEWLLERRGVAADGGFDPG